MRFYYAQMSDHKKYILSVRKLNKTFLYSSIKRICKSTKICSIEEIEAVFSSLTTFSPLYGGRLFNPKESLSPFHVKMLERKHINLLLPLSNHHFSKAAYEQTLPLLEKIHKKGNSIAITNDELAFNLRKDFPLFSLKASVIKMIKTHQDIENNLKIYDFVTLHPALNDDKSFLGQISAKDKIVLFASARCLYRCPKSICYADVSDYNFNSNYQNVVCNCTNKGRKKLVRDLKIFDLSQPEFDGFTYFKIIP